MANDLEIKIQQVAEGQRIVLAIDHVLHEECIPEHVRSSGRVNHFIQAVIYKI